MFVGGEESEEGEESRTKDSRMQVKILMSNAQIWDRIEIDQLELVSLYSPTRKPSELSWKGVAEECSQHPRINDSTRLSHLLSRKFNHRSQLSRVTRGVHAQAVPSTQHPPSEDNQETHI